jgi:hypothetical protein
MKWRHFYLLKLQLRYLNDPSHKTACNSIIFKQVENYLILSNKVVANWLGIFPPFWRCPIDV